MKNNTVQMSTADPNSGMDASDPILSWAHQRRFLKRKDP